jgi:hypothetical protein
VSTSTSFGLTGAIVARSAGQRSRRAVLHVQSAGDPDPPGDIASWFTERAFNLYVADVRLRQSAMSSRRRGPRELSAALKAVDAVHARMRDVDGMTSVIVTAHGRAAVAAALWSQRRTAPEALVLSAPTWPSRRPRLDIACPVLVVEPERARERRLSGAAVPAPRLGNHVTWVTLGATGVAERPFLDELGRWLGAYMYLRDQLL